MTSNSSSLLPLRLACLALLLIHYLITIPLLIVLQFNLAPHASIYHWVAVAFFIAVFEGAMLGLLGAVARIASNYGEASIASQSKFQIQNSTAETQRPQSKEEKDQN